MKALVWLAAFLICTSASADKLKITPGEGAFIFDVSPESLFGQSFFLYTQKGEQPGSEITEIIEDQMFRVDEITKSIPELADSNFTLGIAIMNNAYAVIRGNDRFIAVDPNWLAKDPARLLVIAHEIGHHVCGHTVGMLINDPWAKELEADTFSGFAMRKVEEKFQGITLKTALGWANFLYNPNPTPSHPPAAMRIQAIINGYNNGSPCIGRQVAKLTPQATPSGSIGPTPLWEHNGSTVKLLADGANRSFFYENPRPGLVERGVSAGTLLFTGKKSGNSYSGTAYVFTRCGKRPYQVSGNVTADQRQVTLFGKAPVTDANCNVIRYRNGTLVFTFAGD